MFIFEKVQYKKTGPIYKEFIKYFFQKIVTKP